MNILFYLPLIIIVFLVGAAPVLFLLPSIGLTVWGLFLKDIGVLREDGGALLIWFLLSCLLVLGFMLKKLSLKPKIDIEPFTTLFKVFGPWLIFLIYLYINYFVQSRNTYHQSYALEKINLFMLKGVFSGFLLSAWLLLGKNNTKEKIEKAILFIGVFQSFFIAKTWLTEGLVGRIRFFGLNPIWVAREAGLSLIASLNVLKKPVLKYLLVAIFIFSIVLSGSRAPLLGLIMILLFKYSKVLFRNKKYWLLTPHVIIMLLFLFAGLLNLGLDDYITRGGATVWEERNIQSRISLYTTAWDDFVKNPVLGKGVGSYKYSVHTYPHNIILELLAETGLIGLILFVFAMYPLFYPVISKKRFNCKGVFFWYALFALITAFFSGDLEKNSYLIVFTSLYGTELIMSRKKKNEL